MYVKITEGIHFISSSTSHQHYGDHIRVGLEFCNNVIEHSRILAQKPERRYWHNG
jgi:hypothetical protein